jgi:hypothetical protein
MSQTGSSTVGWMVYSLFLFFNEDVFAVSVAQAVCNTGGWVVLKQSNIMARNAGAII